MNVIDKNYRTAPELMCTMRVGGVALKPPDWGALPPGPLTR